MAPAAKEHAIARRKQSIAKVLEPGSGRNVRAEERKKRMVERKVGSGLRLMMRARIQLLMS